MMSTALVMAVESEQLKIRPATSDRVESGEMTFAQSFGERVGLTANAQTSNSTGDASSEMRAKNSDAPSASSIGVKANAVADQGMMKLSETKSLAMTAASDTGKSLPVETGPIVHADTADREQPKTIAGQAPAGRLGLQQNIEPKTVALAGVSQTKAPAATEATEIDAQPVADVEHGEISQDISNGVLAAEPTAVDIVPHESAERSLLPRDAVEPPVLNETAPAGKTLDVTPVKKSESAKKSEIGAKPALKATGTIESSKIGGAAPIVAGVQGPISAPIKVLAPGEAQPNVVGVTMAKDFGVIGTPTGKLVAGASTTVTDNTSRKATARAGKDEIEATEQAADPTASTAVATGFGVEVAKATTVSTAGKDPDERALAAIGSPTLVHAVGETSSGTVFGTASGQVSAEASGAKAHAGETDAHAVGQQAGLGDQDSSGAASAEMGMSHRTLLATPTTLEVGLANGTQGWLKIRAEMTDGGGVNASLSSATSAGQEMLHRELPALTAYLQEERVAVNTVVVPATSTAGTESRFTGGMDGEGSGQARQDSGHGGKGAGQGPVPATADRVDEISTYIGLNGVGESGSLLHETYTGGGSWLNVRA